MCRFVALASSGSQFANMSVDQLWAHSSSAEKGGAGHNGLSSSSPSSA